MIPQLAGAFDDHALGGSDRVIDITDASGRQQSCAINLLGVTTDGHPKSHRSEPCVPINLVGHRLHRVHLQESQEDAVRARGSASVPRRPGRSTPDSGSIPRAETVVDARCCHHTARPRFTLTKVGSLEPALHTRSDAAKAPSLQGRPNAFCVCEAFLFASVSPPSLSLGREPHPAHRLGSAHR